jgi:Glycosyl transferase family 2
MPHSAEDPSARRRDRVAAGRSLSVVSAGLVIGSAPGPCKSLRVAVAIPAFNEEKLIRKTIATMPDFVDCIIVTNDGSKDRTLLVLQEFRFGGLILGVAGTAYGVLLAGLRIFAGDTPTSGTVMLAVLPMIMDVNNERRP